MHPSSAPADTRRSTVFWILIIITIMGAAMFLPLAPWLVLALWFGSLTRPVLDKVAKVLHGRSRAAALLTVALFLVCLAPVVILVVSVTSEGLDLVKRVAESPGGGGALKSLVSSGSGDGQPPNAVAEGGNAVSALGASMSPKGLVDLVQQHGAKAAQVLAAAAGAAGKTAVGLFVFFWGGFVVLAEGPKAYAWVEAHVPLKRAHTKRFADAFKETGRGLVIGVGLTGFSQALIATIAYFALGVPRALVLGLFTLMASVIPSVGCAIVWVPVAAGLALSGQTTKAIILAAIGVGVVSTIDNVLRPIFSKYGHLKLPSFVIIASMFGGLAMLGGWGLLLGPLFVRLAREALEIGAEERLTADPPIAMPSPLPPEGEPTATRAPTRDAELRAVTPPSALPLPPHPAPTSTS